MTFYNLKNDTEEEIRNCGTSRHKLGPGIVPEHEISTKERM